MAAAAESWVTAASSAAAVMHQQQTDEPQQQEKQSQEGQPQLAVDSQQQQQGEIAKGAVLSSDVGAAIITSCTSRRRHCCNNIPWWWWRIHFIDIPQYHIHVLIKGHQKAGEGATDPVHISDNDTHALSFHKRLIQRRERPRLVHGRGRRSSHHKTRASIMVNRFTMKLSSKLNDNYMYFVSSSTQN